MRFAQFGTKRFTMPTAKSNNLGNIGTYELSEENVMPELSRRQKANIAKFLKLSRIHFELSRRNMDRQTRLQHSGRSIIQTLLIAGSVGIGSTAYAEPAFKGSETRSDRIARDPTSTVDQWGGRPPVERMP